MYFRPHIPLFTLAAVSMSLGAHAQGGLAGRQPDSSNSSEGWTTAPGFGGASVRYREIPTGPTGICELDPNVKSYAGYVDISEEVHMFFWFFETRNGDPKDAPLTAWISGGPGDSSMAELFTENGPCYVNDDEQSVRSNPHSWSNYSNMIYIDQPVQVGFSYTKLVRAYEYTDDDGDGHIVKLDDGEDCPDDADACGLFSDPDTPTANSTEAAAPNFWLTLQNFMKTFPDYSKNEFHFGSESYGGHYVPIFSKYIQDQNNASIPDAQHINLSSILVGNGWFSPKLQMESYYSFGFDPGSTYDIQPKPNESVRDGVYRSLYGKGNCTDQLDACERLGDNETCQDADHFCLQYVQQPWEDATGLDPNNIQVLEADSDIPDEGYVDYLNLPRVMQVLGVNQTYIELNPTVGDAFDSTGDDARELGIIGVLGDLLAQGVRVTLYAGDADYECNWYGIEAVAKAVSAPGYADAGFANLTTPDGVVHGAVKQSGAFSFVRVYEAGHAAGAFQPLAVSTLFARDVQKKDLATGEVVADNAYRSQGPANSTYREDGKST